MIAWIVIVGGSALIGLLTAIIIRRKWGVILAAGIPWIIMFVGLYENDSMWVIALFLEVLWQFWWVLELSLLS